MQQGKEFRPRETAGFFFYLLQLFGSFLFPLFCILKLLPSFSGVKNVQSHHEQVDSGQTPLGRCGQTLPPAPALYFATRKLRILIYKLCIT